MNYEQTLFKIKKLIKKQKYDKALTKINLCLCAINPNNTYYKQYLALSLICDMAKKDPISAIRLLNKANSLEQLGNNTSSVWADIIYEIHTLDDTNKLIDEINEKINEKTYNNNDCISYQDFKNSVRFKKDFKKAFIDSVFSAKIELQTPDELASMAYDLLKNDCAFYAEPLIDNNILYTNNNKVSMLFNHKKNK